MKTETHVHPLFKPPSYLADEMPAAFIVKLGGALISHKDEYCTPNIDIIHEFARIVRSGWDELQGRLIMVLGGGSYGNGVPYRYNLREASHNWKHVDLSMMTIKMFELMSIVTDIFRQEGVPCYPFQASGHLVSHDGRPQNFFIEPIKHALSLGVLPILSGDMVFDSHRRFVIFSSDCIPELFVGRLQLKRVVMMTNVPGVMNYSSGEPEVIARVTGENHEAVLSHAGASRQQDVSGGMKNKVQTLLRLAEMGVESVICDGRKPSILLPALFDPAPPGTVFEPRAENHHKGETLTCSSPLRAAMGPARPLK
jgi:isopentenyl phosphate kinase